MSKSNQSSDELSEFMQYLAANQAKAERLPSLTDLSQLLGISVSTLREQMEVARTLGFIEVRPKTGIRPQPYTFTNSVVCSLGYAVSVDRGMFHHFTNLRNHIEESYWYEAVTQLTGEDQAYLRQLVHIAQAKLHGNPVQIPYDEHRKLHLTIYSHLDNPFVKGLLEAYWTIYEDLGLHLYGDVAYLSQVWNYHQRIVDAICSGDYALGYQILAEHKALLVQRPANSSGQRFE